MRDYATLSEAIHDLKARGYTLDFNLKPDCIECSELELELHPEKFIVDEFYRFEGMSSTDDSSILYAISSEEGHKGLLVDAYGVYADSLNEDMIQKLAIRRP